jgi:hypothetical protein
MKRLALALLLVVAASGCGWAPMAGKELITESIAIRRMVVGENWVLDKKTNVLYKRYIPGKGIGPFRMLHGNKALLAVVQQPKYLGLLSQLFKGPFDGKIVKSNRNIMIFHNYAKAVASGIKFTVSPESVAFVPAKKKELGWWTKRRLEKQWEPGQ